MIERGETANKWDVVVSAPWIGENEREALGVIVAAIYSKLSKEEQLMLSKVVILSPTDRFVSAFNKLCNVKHGSAKLSNTDINEVEVKNAFIITSQKIR